MKIAVDTNILVRAVVQDDPKQGDAASRIVKAAETLAVGTSCLCEFVWVLRAAYEFKPPAIAAAIRELLAAGNVETNRLAVEAGLAMLDAGGDFADGVIAYEGRWLGGETFVSFDRRAVEMLKLQGVAARLL
jgi:predicted nucleic-acid-binding protein